MNKLLVICGPTATGPGSTLAIPVVYLHASWSRDYGVKKT